MKVLTAGLIAMLNTAALAPAAPAPKSGLPLTATPTPAASTAAPATFPTSWIGHWKGDASSGNGVQSQRFTMELVITPTDKPDRFGWTIIYSGAAGKQERPYTLIVKDAAKGLYSIDENNGIVLDARLMGDTLFSHFLIQGNRLTTRDRLEAVGTPEEHISIEIVTTLEDQSSQTGGKDGIPDVMTWSPTGIQTATLRRVAAAPMPLPMPLPVAPSQDGTSPQPAAKPK